MDRHGVSMVTMGLVVGTLFPLEFLLGVISPWPTTVAEFSLLVNHPAFWAAFAANLLLGLAAAWYVTGGAGGDDEEEPDEAPLRP